MKTARTIKPYQTMFKGWDITVPAGSIVSNMTANGPDDNYRFWKDWQSTVVRLTGFRNSILAHYLTYYGLNIPEEYCEPYL